MEIRFDVLAEHLMMNLPYTLDDSLETAFVKTASIWKVVIDMFAICNA